jgi:hypothetical protein
MKDLLIIVLYIHIYQGLSKSCLITKMEFLDRERKQMSDHLIDIADPHVPLVDSMGKELQSLKYYPLSLECIIYKVPE